MASKTKHSILLSLSLMFGSIIVGCGTRPVNHSYGNDSLEVYVLPSGDVVRVRKTSAGPYTGDLLTQGPQARSKLFRTLATQQVKEYCTMKDNTAKFMAEPSLFGHTWGNEKGLTATRADPETSFPQMLEWQFNCQ
jgi:hypothetical protein